jgi:flagellar biosynthesis chaperone FliJ
VKPPRYALQAVVDQREIGKEQAKTALADAVRAVADAEELLRGKEAAREKLVAERDHLRDHIYDPDPAGLLSMPLVEKRTAGVRYLGEKVEEASRAVEDQKQAVARAQALVEERRGRLVEADRELKAVEKHKETWLQEWKREAARKEQRQSEEMVLARYAAENAGDERPE